MISRNRPCCGSASESGRCPALLMTQYKTSTGPSISMGAVCKTRTHLLDQLADAVEILGRAKLDLRNSVESGDLLRSQSIQFEVERLRQDCTGIRSELEIHRAHHHC
jgi:hypothetical protein